MLVEITGQATFFVRDPSTGREWIVVPGDYLTELQEKQMSFQPDMIAQFARYIASQLLIDPAVNLAGLPRGAGPQTWILDRPTP